MRAASPHHRVDVWDPRPANPLYASQSSLQKFSCQSQQVIKRGFDDTEAARQRYECTDCHTRFDDLTDTIFAGHHQPLKVWILCLYFMGLNLSNEQIAQELDVNGSDVQQMTTQLRQGTVKKASCDTVKRLKIDTLLA
jgi:transposase-like protein